MHSESTSERRRARSRVAVGGFTIYFGLAVALAAFFLSTILLVWMFIGPLADWRELKNPANGGQVYDAQSNTSRTNPFLVQTANGKWKTKCLDPYDDNDQQRVQSIGTTLSALNTLIFIANVVWGIFLARWATRCYTTQALLDLPEEEEEEDASMRAAADEAIDHQAFEHMDV